MSVNECTLLETCIRVWYCRRLLADGFSCRLFCDDFLVAQCLLVPALSPCCLIRLSSFVICSTHRRHLLLCLWKFDCEFVGSSDSWLSFLLAEVRTSHRRCVLLAPATSSLGLFSVYVVYSVLFVFVIFSVGEGCILPRGVFSFLCLLLPTGEL